MLKHEHAREGRLYSVMQLGNVKSGIECLKKNVSRTNGKEEMAKFLEKKNKEIDIQHTQGECDLK